MPLLTEAARVSTSPQQPAEWRGTQEHGNTKIQIGRGKGGGGGKSVTFKAKARYPMGYNADRQI